MHRYTDRHAGKLTEIQIYTRVDDGLTDYLTDRPTDRDREIDKQTHREDILKNAKTQSDKHTDRKVQTVHDKNTVRIK